MKNSNLTKAKDAKNDEFYTQLSDIEKELQHYDFKDKVIYCPCDSEESNFVKYFKDNKEVLGYKSFHHSSLPQSFNSPESIELMKQCDIVVTNPPFSLFRDFVAQITEFNKDFLIVGNKNAITYKECFSLIKANKMWLGVNGLGEFGLPNGAISTNMKGLCLWFTSIKPDISKPLVKLTKQYNPEDYPKYDNYDAINVNKIVDIPYGYYGVMGVPITFLTKSFEIDTEVLGCSYEYGEIDEHLGGKFNCVINGVEVYKRLFIKRKEPEQFEILGTTDRGGDNAIEVDAIRLTDKKEGSAKINGEKIYKRLFIKRKEK